MVPTHTNYSLFRAYVLGKLLVSSDPHIIKRLDPNSHSRYTNTLLVVFNNRIFLCNEDLAGRGTRSEDLPSYSPGDGGTIPTSTGRSTTNTGPSEFKIQIFQETTVATDGEMQLKELVGIHS